MKFRKKMYPILNETNRKEYTTNEDTGKSVPEACTARFDIKSFVYRAR